MTRFPCICLLLLAACIALSGCGHRTSIASLTTVAEQSDFTRTARYDDVVAFLTTLDDDPRVTLTSIGTTHEGRDIPMAILADPPVTTPDDITGDRLHVLLFGNIHAGEVCGKEALCMLARDILTSDAHSNLFDDLVISVIPIYNADGNERFNPDNRGRQVGPEAMGIRENAQGYDLNRDYIKLDAPETRALVRTLTTWDPKVIVDTHTTNGSHHRYLLTYQGPKHPAGDTDVLTYVRDTMLPAIDASFEARTGNDMFFYGNFADQHTKWTTYPAEPRYGVAYRGMRNRLSILSEAYSYAPYKDRVQGTYDFCLEILRYAAAHRDDIAALTIAADERTLNSRDPVHLRTEVVPFATPVRVLGYNEYDEAGERIPPTTERDYDVAFINDFVPIESVTRPWAYAIPAEMVDIVSHLERHGIVAAPLDGTITVIAEEVTVDAIHRGRQYEGHALTSVDVSDPRLIRRVLQPGTVIVPTAQPLGTLAAYMLEPRASDGLVTWNFLDPHMTVGLPYPVLRIPHSENDWND